MGACYIVVATVKLLSPCGGETVELLPEAQKSIMAFESYDDRLAALCKDKECGGEAYFRNKDAKWRTSAPLVLKWRTTDGEKGPWRIALGKDNSLSDATIWWIEDGDSSRKCDDGSVVFEWTVPQPNLELGRRYCWKIWSDTRCTNGFTHGSVMTGRCVTCGKHASVGESSLAEFVASQQPPRWIALEGRVKNVRDIGGWRTTDGRRVRQGMVFRGEGLNDNSPSGEIPGRSKLMVEDVAYLKDVLGIKTDLDLRSGREAGGLTASPLGGDVTYVHRSSPMYIGVFSEPGMNDDGLETDGKRAMAENFRVFCNERNYPIYFHCTSGADRTGALAYVLNGVLGVTKHDLETDWEATFYPMLPELGKDYSGLKFWRREGHFDAGFSKYGGKDASWNERIRLYLLDCGITQDEIDKFRSIMLEQDGK